MIVYDYDRRAGAERDLLVEYGLEGMRTGAAVTLYHGTTRLFRTFDLSHSRDDLVNEYYGKGIFLSPLKRIAAMYADANRNIGFAPSIIQDLRRKNPGAAALLQALYDHGNDGWEVYWKSNGFWRDDPGPGEGAVDPAFEAHIGVDGNTLADIAGYIIGSKEKPLGHDGPVHIFNMSSGAPSWIYDSLDEVGLNSKVYRPKVYTVSATVSNPLVTKSKSQARKARAQGYDSVFFHGADLVQGVPEVAVFNPRNVKVRRIEVV